MQALNQPLIQPFVQHTGIVAPLNRANVDTDAIIPKQFLKSIHRTGFGDNLFDEWRYLDVGEPGQPCAGRPLNPNFELNQPAYQGASVLLAGRNFGCGSSREHAPWALFQYGFRAIVAPSFADIFFNNCFKNGLLPIVLPEEKVSELFALVEAQPGIAASINLPAQTLSIGCHVIPFEVDAFRKHCLVNGLDDIGLTLQHREAIVAFEAKHLENFPWLSKRMP